MTLAGLIGLRHCWRCVAVRGAQLGRLPVLQLADVGDTQAELRLALAAEPRDVVPDRPRHLHAHVVHRRRRAARPAGGARAVEHGAAGGAAAGVVGRRSARSSCSCTTSATSGASSSSFRRSSRLAAIVLGRDRGCCRRTSRRVRDGALPGRCPVVVYAAYVIAGAARAAGLPLRARPRRPAQRGARARRHRSACTYLAAGRRDFSRARHGRPAAALLWPRLVSAGRSRSSGSGRAAGPTRTTWRRSSSARCCRRARWSTASWPTASRSRTGSGRSSSARKFGNYADRKQRDDVRYILTYVAPQIGYEGSVIRDVLEAYPDRTIIKTFDVAETAGGPRPGGAHRQVRRRRAGDPAPRVRTHACARLTNAPSRRTPTSASDPSTTTRCSSTTAAPRSSRFSSAPASRVRRQRARRRLRRRRHAAVARRGSRAGGRHRSRRAVSGCRRTARPRARPDQPATSRSPTACICRSATASSIWCCRTRSSSTSPTRRSTCASARGC